MDDLDSLEDVLAEQIGDLQSAEEQLVLALQGMADAASQEKLRDAFETHRQETEQHVKRLEEVVERLGGPVVAVQSAAMKALIEQAERVTSAGGNPTVKDVALIAAAQRVEHYEIAAYGTARTLAEQLNRGEEAELLAATLAEEHQADELLSKLAVGGLLTAGINEQAAGG
jgi:ferritin-like metal-binding protein YciE